MIVVFPALTAKTVDKNILPGIAKALESYAITYLLEDVLKKQGKKKITVKNKRLMMEQYKGMPDTKPSSPSQKQPKKPGVAPDKPSGGHEPRTEVKIDKPNSNEISLPPTWVRVDTPQGTQIIGVKVLPFRVKSDEDFVRALGTDLNRSGFLDKLFTRLGRSLKTILFKIARKFKVPFTSKGISGNVYDDVLIARTDFGKNLFCIYDYTSVKDITSDPSAVRKLFKFYWSSMIFADDANQMAYFCMKHFAGICNAIPYKFLYTLSREAGKVYEDLSASSSASNSIFKVKKKHLTKILGEAHAANTVMKYSNQLLEKDV